MNLLSGKREHIQINRPNVIVAGISDTGLLREVNEDCIWAHDSGKVLVLADGMGGHDRGAEASRTAVDTFSALLSPEIINSRAENIILPADISEEFTPVYAVIYSAVKKAASVMVEKNIRLNLPRYMGTTAAGLVIAGDKKAYWFHVGDSRVYRWRRGNLTCLTVDHSAYAEWEKAGSPGDPPARHLVTRVIGNNPDVEPDINWSEREKGDIYLLCSDGLTDMLPDLLIEDILSSGKHMSDMSEMLVEEALSAGGSDNVSVILCQTLED